MKYLNEPGDGCVSLAEAVSSCVHKQCLSVSRYRLRLHEMRYLCSRNHGSAASDSADGSNDRQTNKQNSRNCCAEHHHNLESSPYSRLSVGQRFERVLLHGFAFAHAFEDIPDQ